MTTIPTTPAVIETICGLKLLQCPVCGHAERLQFGPSEYRDWERYYCTWCEDNGEVCDLPDAPPIDDTHTLFGDIGPIIPPTLQAHGFNTQNCSQPA